MENKHHQLMSISKTYHDTLEEFGKNWLKIMLVAAIPQAIVYLLLFSASALSVNVLTQAILDRSFNGQTGYGILLAVIVLVALLVSLLGLISLNYMVVHHERESVGRTFEHSFAFIWPFGVQLVLTTIMAGIGTLGGYVVAAIIGTLFGLASTELLNIAFNILSYVLPFVGATLVGMFFYFASYAVVEKKMKGIQSLKHSFKVVRGHYWPVFIRVFLLTGVVFALSSVFNLIPYVGVALSILTLTPFSIIYLYTIYKDLEQLKS